MERNYHCRWGELDIVAAEADENEADGMFWEDMEDMSRNKPRGRKSTLHFVEVKTRTGTVYGTPGEAVTYTKQQKIKKTALTWLQTYEAHFSVLSFDVVEVWVAGGTARIRWLTDCF